MLTCPAHKNARRRTFGHRTWTARTRRHDCSLQYLRGAVNVEDEQALCFAMDKMQYAKREPDLKCKEVAKRTRLRYEDESKLEVSRGEQDNNFGRSEGGGRTSYSRSVRWKRGLMREDIRVQEAVC